MMHGAKDIPRFLPIPLPSTERFGDHSINALAGIEYQKLRGNGLSYGGSDYQSTNPAFYQSVKNQQGVETVVGQDADGNDILEDYMPMLVHL
jgi:hypothetical protein